MGKGSIARPFSVDQTTFSQRWEMTFGRKAKEHGSDTAKDGQLIEGDADRQPEEASNGQADSLP